MILPGFPVPTDGETIPSVVARHLARSAGISSTILANLGLKHVAPHALASPRLLKLAECMPEGHPWAQAPEVMVDQHTLAPLYLHFVAPDRRRELRDALCASSSANPAATLGLTIDASRRLSSGYKLCRDCVALDTRERGSPVIYREHQPPFVRTCPRHQSPLFFDCAECRSARRAVSMWARAGICSCQAPRNAPAWLSNADRTREAGIHWLSAAVATILSKDAEPPTTSLVVKLREALLQSGFASGAGLDSDAIKRAVVACFGEELLVDLGVRSSGDGVDRWPGRLLSPAIAGRTRTPDVLRTLLLARLVCSDIRNLWTRSPKPPAPPADVPRGYGSKDLQRVMLSQATIDGALRAANGQLSAAASRLGVSPARLAVDMQHRGMALPLTPGARKRLGEAVIAAAQMALQSGRPKKVIQADLRISEWSLQLIELESPWLRDMHRDAAIEGQRQRHRTAVMNCMRADPQARRSEILARCVSTIDWLRRFDAAWLAIHFPEKETGRGQPRPPQNRRNWHQLDKMFAALVERTAKAELTRADRPVRLTPTSLRGSADIPARGVAGGSADLPLTMAKIEQYAEDDDRFLRRKIAWALHSYARQQIPLSMNQFRRAAALSPRRLLEHRDFIQETCQRLGVDIDPRCILASAYSSFANASGILRVPQSAYAKVRPAAAKTTYPTAAWPYCNEDFTASRQQVG